MILKLKLLYNLTLNVKKDMATIIRLIYVLNVRIVKFVHFNNSFKYVKNAWSKNTYKIIVNNIWQMGSALTADLIVNRVIKMAVSFVRKIIFSL